MARPEAQRSQSAGSCAADRAGLGQDRLGVELHSPGRRGPAAHGHDLVFARPRRDLERVGQTRAGDDQRVVARGLEGVRHALEQPVGGVEDVGGLPVQDVARPLDPAAVHGGDALMAEAHAQDRLSTVEGSDRVHAHARVLGRTGSGRDQETVDPHPSDALGARLVVQHHRVFAPSSPGTAPG